MPLRVQDLTTLDLEPYQYSGVNFTGIRLVDVNNPDVQSTFNDYMFEMRLDSIDQLRSEPALIYDSIQFFARAFKRFKEAVEGNVKALECDAIDNWDFGESLNNYIRTVSISKKLTYWHIVKK